MFFVFFTISLFCIMWLLNDTVHCLLIQCTDTASVLCTLVNDTVHCPVSCILLNDTVGSFCIMYTNQWYNALHLHPVHCSMIQCTLPCIMYSVYCSMIQSTASVSCTLLNDTVHCFYIMYTAKWYSTLLLYPVHC